MSLTLGIICYLVDKKLFKNDLIDKIKNSVTSEDSLQLTETLKKKPIQIESKYFSIISLSIIFIISILIECIQYFSEINIPFESISYAMITIFFIGNIFFSNIYGMCQLYSMCLCVLVTFGIQIYYLIDKHKTKMYVFSFIVNLFIGLKLIFLKYIITTKLYNAFDLYALEGIFYLFVMIFDLCLFFMGFGRFSHVKDKLSNHYIVNEHVYKNRNFYICRNITNFFIHLLYFLMINFSNPNFYLCSDIISKGIYYISIRMFKKKTDDDLPVGICLPNYFIVILCSLVFCELILIKGIKNKEVISKEDLEIIKNKHKENIIPQ
jgi:hypothetical protein